MKITATQLRRIIAEEINNLREASMPQNRVLADPAESIVRDVLDAAGGPVMERDVERIAHAVDAKIAVLVTDVLEELENSCAGAAMEIVDDILAEMGSSDAELVSALGPEISNRLLDVVVGELKADLEDARRSR